MSFCQALRFALLDSDSYPFLVTNGGWLLSQRVKQPPLLFYDWALAPRGAQSCELEANAALF
jgi:hypothetical protein